MAVDENNKNDVKSTLGSVACSDVQPDQPIVSTTEPVTTASHAFALRTMFQRGHWGVWVLVGLVATGLTLAGLVYGTPLYLGKATAGTAAINVHQPDSVLRATIDQAVTKYRFSLQNPDGQASDYQLADAGISVNSNATVQDLRSSIRHAGWSKLLWWHTIRVPLTITKNRSQFDTFVTAHIAIANQAAKDATLAVSGGNPQITDGHDGWTYALPGGNASLARAATTLAPLKVTLTKTSVPPALQRKDLAAATQKINAYLSHTVSFNLDGSAITPSKTDMGNWLDIEPQPDHKTVDVSVNSGKAQAYLDKATKNNIYPPRSQITTTDADGNTTVLISGQDGSAITNEAAVIKGVVASLQQDNPTISADLIVAHAHYTTINAADYPKWIVVDLTTKRMYTYEHASLIRSFLVSAGAPKTPTVIGTYQIYSKVPVKTMRGGNADGSRYVQPNVKYVNYFYRDYAIHGNYWRPTSYFGNINSSHGCVGITDSDAAWVYNWAPIGTTVITHI